MGTVVDLAARRAALPEQQARRRHPAGTRRPGQTDPVADRLAETLREAFSHVREDHPDMYALVSSAHIFPARDGYVLTTSRPDPCLVRRVARILDEALRRHPHVSGTALAAGSRRVVFAYRVAA